MWKSFGYMLGGVLSAVADCCDHSDGTVALTRVARAWPKHYVADVHVKANGVNAVNNLLGLLHPLSTLRKLHRVDEERAVVPCVSLDPGRFCKQDFVCQTGKRRRSQPVWRF